jgi:5'-3' exonuclease
MGIPFYFSYIVKNHSSIIKKLCKNNGTTIHNLFLDCNSIIYDIVHTMNYEELTDTVSASIIRNVILKIESYIDLVQPEKLVYIAFDGVAPLAKLQQQRERRYKSWYQGEITKNIFKTKKTAVDPFNTTAITPGTKFMEELNAKIRRHFITLETRFSASLKFIVSDSSEYGEGEHKLFAYLREMPSNDEENHLVYGLDADLIMLSINHLPVHRNIYLFRETPEFIKSLDSSLEPESTYYLDIPELAEVIVEDMNSGGFRGITDVDEGAPLINRVYDYIFLCFFLGNDFLPHFPAINIRTGGVDKMLNAYKATIGNTKEVLTNGKTIYWRNVRKLIGFLAEKEHSYISDEMRLRDKRERHHIPDETPEQIFAKFENIPSKERELEKYIQPAKPNWQKRYYDVLFSLEMNEERKKQVCVNYLEGLEWTMKYYTSGCADWRWYYKYNYPPLLSDLIHFVPYFDTEFVSLKPANPVSPLVQLSYVLPRASLSLLPEPLFQRLSKDHDDWYPDDCEFIWAFCKYFWESHVQLPEIEMGDLERLVEKNK